MRFILKGILILFIAVIGFGAGSLNAQTNVVYKIQVASHPKEYSLARIKSDLGLSQDVSMHYIGGRYKYFVGSYATRSEAQADVSKVPVTGAWVVPVTVSGEKVIEPVKDPAQEQALEKPKEDPATPVDTKTEMRYRIQVAAESKFIDPEQVKINKGLDNFDLDHYYIDGFYKYVIGDFATREQAEKARIDNKIEGFVVRAPVEYGVEPEVQEENLEKPEEQVQKPAESEQPAQDGDDPQTDTTQFKAPAEDYEASLMTKYDQYIKLADDAFSAGDLSVAREFYVKASNLDQNQGYPKGKIVEIDRVLDLQKGQQTEQRIKTVIFVVLVLVLMLVVVLAYTLFMRGRRKKREKETEKLKDEIQDSVTEYLFDEEAGRPEMIDSITGSRDKQVLIDEIMQLYSNLSGEISNRLRELYIDLGLDNESVKKTQSPQWHLRAKGFRELAQMNIKTVNDEIESCLNSDNDVLRMEAQLAMVRLNYDNPFSFLDKLDKPFTSWEQLHVYEMISRHQINVPDFYQWLSSRNESVVIFSVRMIRAFKQTENYQQLFPLLDSPSAEVREEVIVTLGELRVTETLPILKTKYLSEDQSGKVLILQALSNMPEEDNIDFLQSILEPSNSLRLEAAEALARIESFGVKGIETILRRSDDDLQAVARHILDSKTR